MSRRRASHVIALAGPSGSGKTTLANTLAHRLPGGGRVFGLDAYYHDQSDVAEEVINVDVPGALDHVRIVTDLRALSSGRRIRQPVYDYATHARLSSDRVVAPAPYIIVDGLYALYWEEVRALVHTAVFVALGHDECLRRRVARDARERGRTAESVERFYRRTVRPMYDLHVDPTRRFADVVLDGSLSLEELTRQLLVRLSA